MPKAIQIDADLYARAAAAAARESKDVETYIGELIRLHVREAEKMHELVRALDDVQIEGNIQAMPKCALKRTTSLVGQER